LWFSTFFPVRCAEFIEDLKKSLEDIHKLVDPGLEEIYPIESVLKMKALFIFFVITIQE